MFWLLVFIAIELALIIFLLLECINFLWKNEPTWWEAEPFSFRALKAVAMLIGLVALSNAVFSVLEAMGLKGDWGFLGDLKWWRAKD